METNKPIGYVERRVTNSFGDWVTERLTVLSIAEPRNVRGKVSFGNWAIEYETQKGQRTEYVFTKKQALAWIDEVKHAASPEEIKVDGYFKGDAFRLTGNNGNF